MSNDKDTPKFQVYKYETGSVGSGSPYLDMSDAYANNIETVLSFEYVPTGKAVYFKAFITALNEAFNTSYNTEPGLFGRVDPIHTFSNIQRSISFTFSIPAASSGEAFENLGNVQQLAQFMYPTYEEGHSKQANRISESPLIRLKIMNIIQKPSNSDATNTSATGSYAAYQSSLDTTTSLLGTLNSISIDHNLGGEEGVIEKGENVVLPKLITVTCDFTAIHEEDLGWDAGGSEDMTSVYARRALAATPQNPDPANASFANEAFPYGAVLAETEVAPAASSQQSPDEQQADANGPGSTAAIAGASATASPTANGLNIDWAPLDKKQVD